MNLRRRDVLCGSFLAALSATLKIQASSLHLASFFTGKSHPLRAVSVGAPVSVLSSRGDTWAPTWADDGYIYSPSNDTSGFRGAANANIAFNRIDGHDPFHLDGITVNPMLEYGKETEKGPMVAAGNRAGAPASMASCTGSSPGINTERKAEILTAGRQRKTRALSRAPTTGARGHVPPKRIMTRQCFQADVSRRRTSSNSAAMNRARRMSATTFTHCRTMDFGIAATT